MVSLINEIKQDCGGGQGSGKGRGRGRGREKGNGRGKGWERRGGGRRCCQDRAARSERDVGEEGWAVWDLMVSD